MRWGAIVILSLAAACGEKQSAVTDGGLGKGDAGDASVSAADAGPDDAMMPHASNEELGGRMKHLLEAISQNNADLASDCVFPRDAFVATKDVPDPQKAWDKKLDSAFRRSVEKTHKRTHGIEGARFVSFELGTTISQLSPKKKDFKKPLWRVKHSKLTYTVEGKTKHIDVAEMVAWRGSWYVTRLK